MTQTRSQGPPRSSWNCARSARLSSARPSPRPCASAVSLMCARNDGRRRRFRSAPTPTPLKSRNECGTSAGSTRFWVCDISYLRTLEGWLYLATVIDAHSRRVIGWAVDEHMRADLVEDALRMAITMRGELTEKVTFHTDRGTQPGFKTRSSRSPTRTGSPARWVTPGSVGTTRWPSRSSPPSRPSSTTDACGPPRRRLASKSASGSRTATTVDVDTLHSARSHQSLLRMQYLPAPIDSGHLSR